MGAADEAKKPAGLARYPRHRKLSEKGAAAAAAAAEASLVGAADGDSSDLNFHHQDFPLFLDMRGKPAVLKRASKKSKQDFSSKKAKFPARLLVDFRGKNLETDFTEESFQRDLEALRAKVKDAASELDELSLFLEGKYPKETSRRAIAQTVLGHMKTSGLPGGLVHVFGGGSRILGDLLKRTLARTAVVSQSDIVEKHDVLKIDQNARPIDAAGKPIELQDASVVRNACYHPGLGYQMIRAMLQHTKEGGLIVCVVLVNQFANAAAGIREALRVDCLVNLNVTHLKLDIASNSKPQIMLTANRGPAAVSSMLVGADLVNRALFGDPTAAALKIPPVAAFLTAAKQGFGAMVEKENLRETLGHKKNRFSSYGAAIQSIVAGTFFMEINPKDLGLGELCNRAKELGVPVSVLHLIDNLNPAVDAISVHAAAVKIRLETAKEAGSAAGKYTALSNQGIRFEDYIGTVANLGKGQQGSAGGGLYTFFTQDGRRKGVGQSRECIGGRVKTQLKDGENHWLVLATFSKLFCGFPTPDHTRVRTFAIEAEETWMTLTNGGLGDVETMIASPTTIGYSDSSSGGRAAICSSLVAARLAASCDFSSSCLALALKATLKEPSRACPDSPPRMLSI